MTGIILADFMTLLDYQTTNQQKMQVHPQCWADFFRFLGNELLLILMGSFFDFFPGGQVKVFWSTFQHLHDFLVGGFT